MFEYDTVNRWVFRYLRKVFSDGADVTSGGRLFQTWGPATGKALSPTVNRLDCGWMRRLVLAERRARRLGKSATRTNGPRYDGAQPWRTLYVSTAILNSHASVVSRLSQMMLQKCSKNATYFRIWWTPLEVYCPVTYMFRKPSSSWC